MLSIPRKINKSYTIIRAINLYRLLSLPVKPIEAQLLSAAIGHYFFHRSRDIEQNQYKLDLPWMLHCLDLNRFKHDYKSSYNVVRLQGMTSNLKQLLSNPKAYINPKLVDYCHTTHDDYKTLVFRSHIQSISRLCNRSSLPLKLYLMIAMRTIKKRGYARINQEIVSDIFGCSTRQLRTAQEQLISIGLLDKRSINPILRCKHGIIISIIGRDETSGVTVMRLPVPHDETSDH